MSNADVPLTAACGTCGVSITEPGTFASAALPAAGVVRCGHGSATPGAEFSPVPQHGIGKGIAAPFDAPAPRRLSDCGSAWSRPELIDSVAPGDAASPVIAFDRDGHAVVAWHTKLGSRHHVWSSRSTGPTHWAKAELIESADAGSAFAPQLAFEAHGAGLVLWQQWHPERDRSVGIWCRRYCPDLGWMRAEEVAGSAVSPRIATSANGDAMAIWCAWDGFRDRLMARHYTPEQGWSGAQRVEHGDGGLLSTRIAFGPQLAFDGQGNAVAVWYQRDTGGRLSVCANRYVPGVGWGVATQLQGEEAIRAHSPRVAVDVCGNALVVWNDESGGQDARLWFCRYTARTGWSAAAPIAPIAPGAYNPRLAVDARGNALLVWQQEIGRRAAVLSCRYDAAAGWDGNRCLALGEFETRFPRLAMDGSGNAIALWLQDDGKSGVLWFARYAPGHGWSGALPVEHAAGDLITPSVAFDPTGAVVAVWSQSDGRQARILASRLERA